MVQTLTSGVARVGEAELLEIAHQDLGIEDAHDELLAEGGRQGGNAQLDLLPGEGARLDAPVLRPALLHHVHAREDLDAARHGDEDRRGNLVDLVQHAVDAEAHDALLAARLDVDVARALLEGVGPEPVDDAHHVRVVRVDRLVALAELDELLEIGEAARAGGVLSRPLDRLRQVVELDLIALDVERVGDDALDVALDDRRELLLPVAHMGLGRGDDRFLAAHADRQDAKARRVRGGHHLGHAGEVDLQRIDVHVFHADALGEPLGERFERKGLAARARLAPLLLGDDDERMQGAAVVAPLLLQVFGRLGGDELVLDHPVEQLADREPVRRAFCLNCLLHRQKTIPQTLIPHGCAPFHQRLGGRRAEARAPLRHGARERRRGRSPARPAQPRRAHARGLPLLARADSSAAGRGTFDRGRLDRRELHARRHAVGGHGAGR